jgi:hypothetical protein
MEQKMTYEQAMKRLEEIVKKIESGEMDIDLLAKMVRETILDHDAVTLPGIGSFMAEIVPSSFSDKGYTINPPYRRLVFSRGKCRRFFLSLCS